MIINTALIKHPVNWITIFLMVFIGVMVVNLILSPWHVGQRGGDATTLSANSTPSPPLSMFQ